MRNELCVLVTPQQPWLGSLVSVRAKMACMLPCPCRGAVTIAFVAAAVAYLTYMPPLEPAVVVGAPERTNLQTEHTQNLDERKYTRTTIDFPCVDAVCEAWLYMPKQHKAGALPPVVVMAHGECRCAFVCKAS